MRPLPPARDTATTEAPVERTADAPELEAIRARLLGITRESYLLLYSLMKSISIAAFAYAIVDFSPAETDAWLTRSTFWAVGLVGLILTYHAAVFGSVIHPLSLTVVDSALPLLLAAAEALLFFTLGAEPSQTAVPELWYFAFAAWAGLAAAIVTRVRREIAAEASSSSPAATVFDNQVEHLKADRTAASALALAALIVGVLKVLGPLDRLGPWEALIGLVVVFVLVKALDNQRSALRTLRQDLNPDGVVTGTVSKSPR